MNQLIKHQAYARLGLMGNPGDALGGPAIAITIKNYYAEATLEPSDQIQFNEPEIEVPKWNTIEDFVKYTQLRGYHGGRRLMQALFSRFIRYAQSCGKEIRGNHFTLSWNTTIPNRVGLGGSSALITSALRCLMDFYSFPIPKLDQVDMVLKTELVELNIPAGPMDRVAQVYEGLVHFDHNGDKTLKVDTLNPDVLPPLFVAVYDMAGEGTEVFHTNLRERFHNNDPNVIEGLKKLRSYTTQGWDFLKENKGDHIGELMDANYKIRSGLVKLNPKHSKMVEDAWATGAHAHFAGSGGAIVGTCSLENMPKVLQYLNYIGYTAFQPEIKREESHG